MKKRGTIKWNMAKSKSSTCVCISSSTKKLVKCKRSQLMGIPFGVIFSLILIALFIVIAIVAIKIFYNPGGCGLNEQSSEFQFVQNLQETIDNAWNSARTEELEYLVDIHSSIKSICFVNYMAEGEGKGKDSDKYLAFLRYGEGNLFLYPSKSACEAKYTLKHINITEITKNNNPFCVENGKKLVLDSRYGSPVLISGK